ncbi:Hypothetical protein SRAE_2000518300 [Strongyloides ratti]|uniref:Uncharacterized protein n=1 Tax=Strongyloides ratti TaxID=34506 RepID=A0A090LL54_STRRB|nr:Hypothetical protein SRAE_2000518300 [Strongyloides ratti]CEF70554.1 Hypothetical protein SRAE_2000518300 [Strongyloides ratti]
MGMSNFYVKTNLFFKAGGILIDQSTKEEFKMTIPLNSLRPRFPDDVADRKIRIFPYCSQEYKFSLTYKPSFNIKVYLEKNGIKYNLCSKGLEKKFETHFVTGIILIFIGILLALTTTILCLKSMTNSCIDTNTNLGGMITSTIGIIILPAGAIVISNSLNYFLENLNLTKDEKNAAGLPEPRFNKDMSAGITLLIIHFFGNIFIMAFGAYIRSKELKTLSQKIIEMENNEKNVNIKI